MLISKGTPLKGFCSRFPSDKHLASWAGAYPGNKKSGGKRLSGQSTHGNTSLRAVLGEVLT
jgi:transposase